MAKSQQGVEKQRMFNRISYKERVIIENRYRDRQKVNLRDELDKNMEMM